MNRHAPKPEASDDDWLHTIVPATAWAVFIVTCALGGLLFGGAAEGLADAAPAAPVVAVSPG